MWKYDQSALKTQGGGGELAERAPHDRVLLTAPTQCPSSSLVSAPVQPSTFFGSLQKPKSFPRPSASPASRRVL